MYQDKSLKVKPFIPELLPLAERFSSGNTHIDKYLQDGDCSLNHALGRTYVFLPEGEENIVSEYIGAAFITLNSTEQGYKLYIRNGFEPLDNDMSVTMEDSDADCTQLYKWIEEEW